MMIAVARAGSTVFWKAADASRAQAAAARPARVERLAIGWLAVAMLLVVLNAGPMTQYAESTAAQLLDRRAYVGAVLGAQPVPPAWTPREGMKKAVMSRLVPAPLLSVVLFGAWLLLNGALGGARCAGGRARHRDPVVHGTVPARPVSPALVADARGPRRRPCCGTSSLSNVQVAWLIVGPERRIHPRFVWLPLDIRDPHGIATLAGIITMTPGTLSADLTEDRRHLLVHALNVGDEAALVASIKNRYEAPLRRIFEGNT